MSGFKCCAVTYGLVGQQSPPGPDQLGGYHAVALPIPKKIGLLPLQQRRRAIIEGGNLEELIESYRGISHRHVDDEYGVRGRTNPLYTLRGLAILLNTAR